MKIFFAAAILVLTLSNAAFSAGIVDKIADGIPVVTASAGGLVGAALGLAGGSNMEPTNANLALLSVPITILTMAGSFAGYLVGQISVYLLGWLSSRGL